MGFSIKFAIIDIFFCDLKQNQILGGILIILPVFELIVIFLSLLNLSIKVNFIFP